MSTEDTNPPETAQDTARAWLAERMYDAWGTQSWPRPAPEWADLDDNAREDYLTAATEMLSGVEVEPAYEHDPTGPRLAILIPVDATEGGV